jgi:hypothetical protein
MKKIALLGLIGLLAFSCVTTGNSSSGRQSRQTGPSLTEEEMEQLASYKALESSPGRRKPSLGLPEEQSTLHLGAQQVIMGQLSPVGLCRRNTTSRVEEYGGLREVSFLSVKKQRKSAKFN